MGDRRGSLIIEVIVVAVIIVLLAGAYLGLFRRSVGGEDGKSLPKAATDKARGVECANNLNQLRMTIQMKAAEDGQNPPALDPNNSLSKCPVTGKPYSYDASTGTVRCTTPGHETF